MSRQRPVQRRRSRLTRQGLALALVALLLGAAALQRPTAALVGTFGVAVGLFFASGIVSGAALLRIRATRRVPSSCRVGEAVVLEYHIQNRSRLVPLCDVTIVEVDLREERLAPAWIGVLAPRATARAEALFRPTRRGRVALGMIEARSAAPLGLTRKSIAWGQPRTMVVTPEIVRLRDGVVASLTERAHGGASMGRGAGPGEDPAGLREWRRGDRSRNIVWRRSTAPGALVVVERTEPERPRVRIILNLRQPTETLRSTGGEPRELEEQAISLAASLAASAAAEGLECGLEVLGFPDARLLARRGGRHAERLQRLLGEIDLNEPRRVGGRSKRSHPAREIVVHPERADFSIGGRESIHLTSRQFGELRRQA